MATGVLPILIGSATKAQDLTPDSGKEYVAGFRLGVVTDTEDSTGTVKETFPVTADEKALESALSHFRGEILQVPPMYSAIQKNGVRLYDLARKGIEVEREARPVTIHELELLEYRQETGEGSIPLGKIYLLIHGSVPVFFLLLPMVCSRNSPEGFSSRLVVFMKIP